MKEKAVVRMNVPDKKQKEWLEIPLDITANDLILALGQIYSLRVEEDLLYSYYVKCDNPKALLRGGRTLKSYGLRDGSELWIWNR